MKKLFLIICLLTTFFGTSVFAQTPTENTAKVFDQKTTVVNDETYVSFKEGNQLDYTQKVILPNGETLELATITTNPICALDNATNRIIQSENDAGIMRAGYWRMQCATERTYNFKISEIDALIAAVGFAWAWIQLDVPSMSLAVWSAIRSVNLNKFYTSVYALYFSENIDNIKREAKNQENWYSNSNRSTGYLGMTEEFYFVKANGPYTCPSGWRTIDQEW